MGVISRSLQRETRATYKNPEEWFKHWLLGDNARDAGVAVTANTAMAVGAYYACIRNIAQDIAGLPRGVYERLEKGRMERTDHDIAELIENSPNDEMTGVTFWETLIAHALGYTGGYAEIVRDGNGRPVALYPLDPQMVTIERNGYDSFYAVRRGYGEPAVPMMPDQIFHIHGLGYSGLSGYALTVTTRETLAKVIAAQKHASSFFANSALSQGVLQIPTVMKPESMKRLSESFAERYAGVGNHYKPIILENGLTWNSTQIDPQKSQLLETLQHNWVEVCQLFRMPPHKIQDLGRATWGNISSLNLEYVSDCLMPWIRKIEQECARKLLRPQERATFYVRHNVKARLRGDAETQSNWYQKLFGMASLTPNDILRYEDEDEIEGPEGDTRFVATQYMPLLNAIAPPKADAPPVTDPMPEPEHEGTDQQGMPNEPMEGERGGTDQGRDAIIRECTSELRDAIQRKLKMEHDQAVHATKAGRLHEWVLRFYPKHRDYIVSAVEPALKRACDAIGKAYTQDISARIADDHIARSRADMDEVQFWLACEARANQQANDIMEALAHG